MNIPRSKTWWIRAEGPWACFTATFFRSERFSNLVGSHAAWAALLKSVFGKRGYRWVVEEVRLLKRPRRIPITSNELKFNSCNPRGFTVEDERTSEHTQRTTVYLRDVEYLIQAHFELSTEADPDDTIEKGEAMFERRILNGQQFRQAYFGIRECMAFLELADENNLPPTMEDVNEVMGPAYYDTDWEDPERPEYFVPLAVIRGVARYPSWPEVRKHGFRNLLEKKS